MSLNTFPDLIGYNYQLKVQSFFLVTMLKTVQQKKYVCGLSGRAVASFAHYLVNKNIVKDDINIACLVINTVVSMKTFHQPQRQKVKECVNTYD